MTFSTSPVPRRPLSETAASHIRTLITSGQLAPGQLVRPEFVREMLGISTTPAREALQLLRVEGYLELTPGRGFVVAPLSGDDIRDIFTAQSLLAGELAARAARNADPAALAELDEMHLAVISAADRDDTETLEVKNHEFHRLINIAARSGKILWALLMLMHYVPREFYASIPGWPEATVEDHGELLAALHAGDAERARRSMTKHILHAGELLAANLDARMERTGSAVLGA